MVPSAETAGESKTRTPRPCREHRRVARVSWASWAGDGRNGECVRDAPYRSPGARRRRRLGDAWSLTAGEVDLELGDVEEVYVGVEVEVGEALRAVDANECRAYFRSCGYDTLECEVL